MSRTVCAFGLSRVQSEKGNVPVASSLTVTAQAYTSDAGLPGSLSRHSGAMYSRVPIMCLRCRSSVLTLYSQRTSRGVCNHLGSDAARPLHPLDIWAHRGLGLFAA